MPGDSLKFSVNISPVTYPQDNNLTAFKIEDNSIISDSESISSIKGGRWFQNDLNISLAIPVILVKGGVGAFVAFFLEP